MFINIDNDDYFLKYYSDDIKNKNDMFYKEENTHDILSPREGLAIGNLFYNSYIPYKHYKPRELVARNEKEQLMLKIQELCFAQNDLNLYLDVYPNDQRAFQLFKNYTTEGKKLSEVYAEKYGPLELNQDLGTNYDWYKNPWPWEGNENV